MPYSDAAHDLLAEYKLLEEQEAAATKNMNEYLQKGGVDIFNLTKLSEKMEQVHLTKIQVYEQLQQYRIDEE
jgi:hypothetical protein